MGMKIMEVERDLSTTENLEFPTLIFHDHSTRALERGENPKGLCDSEGGSLSLGGVD
jgi:hypothetical protein